MENSRGVLGSLGGGGGAVKDGRAEANSSTVGGLV